MAFKPKINSLRCRKWYSFARRRIEWLRSIDVPVKAYIIDGYHILLKALIYLAVIKAPPGLAIFRKGRDKNNNPAVVINYADMYGFGKEKVVEIQSLRSTNNTIPPINPLDTGWPGNILPLALGGFDFINLLFGGRPDGAVATPTFFQFPPASALYLQTLAPAAYSIRYLRGFNLTQESNIIPAVYAAVNVENKHYFVAFLEIRNFDIGYLSLYYGVGANKAYGNFGVIGYPLTALQSRWEPVGDPWYRTYVVYAYPWKHYNSVKKKDVLLICWVIQGIYVGFYKGGTVWLFTEFEVFDDFTYNFTILGETTSQQIYALAPYSDHDHHTDIAGLYFQGQPATQGTQITKIKTLVLPLPQGELLFAQWNYPEAADPEAPVLLVVNGAGTPRIYVGVFQVPYSYSITDPDKDFANPFCVRVAEAEYPLPALYLYWKEFMRYGGDEIDILDLKYGTPFAIDGWIAFPDLPDETWHLTNFTPIKITWDHRIVLAVVHKDGEVVAGGGTYTALLDTERSPTWIIGQRFSETRVDRCSPTVFGEHPYVFERMKYGGTQWGWDYSYCENYPEPPGGYP